MDKLSILGISPKKAKPDAAKGSPSDDMASAMGYDGGDEGDDDEGADEGEDTAAAGEEFASAVKGGDGATVYKAFKALLAACGG